MFPSLTAESWRGAAQQQASQFAPNSTGLDDFGTSVGQPLLALDSAIPGLTPGLDREARRQLGLALLGRADRRLMQPLPQLRLPSSRPGDAAGAGRP